MTNLSDSNFLKKPNRVNAVETYNVHVTQLYYFLA